MRDYPRALPRIDQVEPVPRRTRAVKDGVTVLDTRAAHYVFEIAYYPQFYVPRTDVRAELVATDEAEHSSRGDLVWHDLVVADTRVPRAARVLTDAGDPVLRGTVRFEWGALDSWFEEDEEVFVHPRNPYARVDALRSTTPVHVEADGVLLAESPAPVLVFETGLPTRYYVDKSAVHFEHLVASGTHTQCPYKGRTTGDWDLRVGDDVLAAPRVPVAWCYDFPTPALAPIAGLVAFLNDRVTITVGPDAG